MCLITRSAPTRPRWRAGAILLPRHAGLSPTRLRASLSPCRRACRTGRFGRSRRRGRNGGTASFDLVVRAFVPEKTLTIDRLFPASQVPIAARKRMAVPDDSGRVTDINRDLGRRPRSACARSACGAIRALTGRRAAPHAELGPLSGRRPPTTSTTEHPSTSDAPGVRFLAQPRRPAALRTVASWPPASTARRGLDHGSGSHAYGHLSSDGVAQGATVGGATRSARPARPGSPGRPSALQASWCTAPLTRRMVGPHWITDHVDARSPIPCASSPTPGGAGSTARHIRMTLLERRARSPPVSAPR